jgi:UDP-N-acetylmuramoyl-tripeptide--D-alanyl-D-alanine ligase
MRLVAGVAGATIVDDTYNSSPAAADAALVSLGGLARTGRKVAILGDMLELGRYSVGAHRDIGARAAENVDILITIGLRARGIADGARDAGLPNERIHSFEQGAAAQAAGLVRAGLSSGDVVLVKGSQGMRLERVVEELMADPERAKDLLVRQEDEWLAR